MNIIASLSLKPVGSFIRIIQKYRLRKCYIIILSFLKIMWYTFQCFCWFLKCIARCLLYLFSPLICSHMHLGIFPHPSLIFSVYGSPISAIVFRVTDNLVDFWRQNLPFGPSRCFWVTQESIRGNSFSLLFKYHTISFTCSTTPGSITLQEIQFVSPGISGNLYEMINSSPVILWMSLPLQLLVSQVPLSQSANSIYLETSCP